MVKRAGGGVEWFSSISLIAPLFHHVSLFYSSPDGARVASSTGIDILLLDDFKLVINDTAHLVRPPRRGAAVHFMIISYKVKKKL